MRKIIFIIVAFGVFTAASCSTTSRIVDTYADASLVAEQRTEIEQLKRNITDMAATQREVSERIDSITSGLARSLEQCDSIEDVFAEIDRFVRELITENTKLRELKYGNQPENAGNE